MFQKVADTIKFWREPDVQAGKKKQRYEAILFTDLECPSCKEVYPLLKKKTSLRLGICQMPLTEIHPHALESANRIETGNDAKNFWRLMDGLQSGGGPPVGSRIYSKASQEASQRVAAMRAAAQAAGVTETPTLWVRARASADGEKPMQTWTARGISGIKFVLEKLP
jgi:protein-disulfide isomerase